LAIFISATARVRVAALASTTASCAESRANLFPPDTKGRPVSSAMRRAATSPKREWAFSPVPTAVPPMASGYRPSTARPTTVSAWASWAAQPEIAWPSVSGVASCRWVRPIITTSAKAAAFSSKVRRSAAAAGSNAPASSSTSAMCITVGKASLEDWPRLTWSFGWTGDFEPRAPPASWIARLAITSLAFMLDWVPEPVWNTTSGNSSSQRPSTTSCAARAISSTVSGGSWPSSPLARAQAFFSTPKARTTGRPQR
jgi:hypothetical protein